MKRFFISILLILSGLKSYTAETVALKTNLIYDAFLSPNIGFELGIADSWSVDISGNYNPFAFSHSRMWKHWMLQPEVRRWNKKTYEGLFLSGHLFGGQFNYSFDQYRRQGFATGVGVGLGYVWRITRRFGMEVELAVGYARYRYDKYPCSSCGSSIATRSKNYVGPTKAAFNMVVYLGDEEKKKTYVPRLRSDDSSVQPPNFKFIIVEAPETGMRRMKLFGSADVKFARSETTVDPSYLDNEAQIARIVSTIDSIKAMDNCEITGMWMKGYASPEGPYDINERLARERVAALRDYIADSYSIVFRCVDSNHEPEDWAGLGVLVESSSLPHKDEIQRIIESSLTPDEKDRRISREYPDDYTVIRDEFYPLLRHTDYKVEYVHYYKKEEKSALHDVNLAISAGNYDKARELLDRLPESPEATYALGIVEALCGNYTEAETILEKAVAGGVCQSENALRQIKEYRIINLKNTNNKH